MRRNNLQSGIFGCLIFLASCSSRISNAPTIEIINPEMNLYHDLSTDLNLEVEIQDDVMIDDYEIWLKSKSGFEYFHDHRQVQKREHKLLYRFDLSNTDQDDFLIVIMVKDFDANITEKHMDVLVH